MGGYGPPIRFGNASEVVNNQPPLQHPEFVHDYQVGSISNGLGSIAAFQQHVNESHHDLVNLLTQQMTTILNPIMVDHETKFERLTRQVEWIAQIFYYDEGDWQNVEINPENLENMPRNTDGDIRLGGDIPRVEILQKGKEKFKSEKKSKSKTFARKEKSEESDVEFPEVDFAELKRGPPYVCSLLKKITSFDKANDMKYTSGKKYNFDISKSYQTFDVLHRDK
ncbi:hypothetical protein Ahy_A10g050124 [Arachis hypogaea]|uniref:Uncharacterized protein n=1 Tax=Arachis hypogaea TaxID=3818 RepID=A0A445B8P2_ARAHY|nr:hypothetical protein Ahy_A10g050124 [Arachis hypogaea]